MTGSKRREEIVRIIRESKKAIPAKQLAEAFGVSRQVIVQDIALIRVAGYDILSTNRGYILNESQRVSRWFKVNHTQEQMEDEMNLIVDLGGELLNVMVNHRVYGQMAAPLHINSRRKVKEFADEIQSSASSPLMTITSNYHYHEVAAESEEILDEIEKMLRERGYLVEARGIEE